MLSADSGEQALLISGRYDGIIDLLIAELVLSRMGGDELSQRLIELRPGTKVILCPAALTVRDSISMNGNTRTLSFKNLSADQTRPNDT